MKKPVKTPHYYSFICQNALEFLTLGFDPVGYLASYLTLDADSVKQVSKKLEECLKCQSINTQNQFIGYFTHCVWMRAAERIFIVFHSIY